MYTKLFNKILQSSVWLESHAARIVWITLMASADEDGFCQFASPANVANCARVTLDEALEAIRKFESPDEFSSNPDNDGRRIERTAGGWIMLNHKKHRDIVTREEERRLNRERQARFRQKKADQSAPKEVHVTPKPLRNGKNNGRVTQSETDAESVPSTTAPPPRRGDDPDLFGTPVEITPAAHAGEEPTAGEPADGKKQRIAGSNRGCRLPDSFAVTEEHRTFAAKHGFRPPDDLIAEFRDYWIAMPGSRGIKLDWDATFRNRMRQFPLQKITGGNNGKNGETRQSPAKQRIDGARRVLAKIALDRGLIDLDRHDGGAGAPISGAGSGI